MAKTTTTTAETYDPEAEYEVQVMRPVYVGAFHYLPRDVIVARGDFLIQMIEENGPNAIRSAVKK